MRDWRLFWLIVAICAVLSLGYSTGIMWSDEWNLAIDILVGMLTFALIPWRQGCLFLLILPMMFLLVWGKAKHIAWLSKLLEP